MTAVPSSKFHDDAVHPIISLNTHTLTLNPVLSDSVLVLSNSVLDLSTVRARCVIAPRARNALKLFLVTVNAFAASISKSSQR